MSLPAIGQGESRRFSAGAPSPASRRRSSALGPVDKVKRVFESCDQDGSGTISRAELSGLLLRLGNFSAGEVDQIMQEIDKDESGDIDYEEFLRWISAPGSKIEVTESEAVCFDLETALKPLFKVFDRNDSGAISISEFQDCYTILTGAFKALPQQDGSPRLAALVSSDSDRIFQIADKDNNNELSFGEFVEWQREAIQHSGISHHQLVELVQRLSCLLQDIFMFSNAKTRRNSDTISQDPVLGVILPKVATCSRELWKRNTEDKTNTVSSEPIKADSKPPAPIEWPALPVGIDTQKLVKRHLQDPVPTNGVKKIKVRIHSAVPDLTDQYRREEGVPPRWLAKVLRSVHYNDGHSTVIQFYYDYNYHAPADTWAWSALPEREHFYKAMGLLPPALRLYSLLLAEADFGENLLWSQVQMVMEDAKKMGLITSEEHLEFNLCTEKTMMRELENLRVRADYEKKKEILKDMVEQAHFSPVQVMQRLTSYYIVPEHPLWAEKSKA